MYSFYVEEIIKHAKSGRDRVLIVFDNFTSARLGFNYFMKDLKNQDPFLRTQHSQLKATLKNGAEVYFDYAESYHHSVKFTGMRYTKVIMDIGSIFELDTIERITSRDFGKYANREVIHD